MKISVHATTTDLRHVTSQYTFSETHSHMDTLMLLAKGLLFDLNVDKVEEPSWSVWLDGNRVLASGEHNVPMAVSEDEVDWSFGGTVKID